MPHFILAITLLVGRPTPQPAPFQLMLERTATGWSARCDSGCSWTKLSASCLLRCHVTIDNNGVTLGTRKVAETATFSFVLTRTASGWSAVSQKGMAWRALTLDCGPRVCQAILNGFGVWGVGQAPPH